METRFLTLVGACCASAVALQGCSKGLAQGVDRTAKAGRDGIVLAVYADDFGMVSEQRRLPIPKGSTNLDLTEVSKTLDPRTLLLHLRDPGENGPKIVGNAYDLGIGSPSELVTRYVGQDVEFVRYGENGEVAERITGKLIVASRDEIVLDSGGNFIVNPKGTMIMPKKDQDATIPHVSVQLKSDSPVDTDLSLAYLTRGLSWSSDYVLTLPDRSEEPISFECWASVTNKTGVNFPQAKVILVAGQPNRAATTAESQGRGRDGESKGLPATDVTTDLASVAVGDLESYRVEDPADIADGEMNRLLVFRKGAVSVQKDYSCSLPPIGSYYYEDWGTPSKPQRGSVQLSLAFFNKEEDGLGKPMPAGAMRVYGRDREAHLVYLGASNIANTPRNAKINATISNVFDLYTERMVTSSVRMDKHTVRKSFEIDLHNEKSSSATLRVVQALYGGFHLVNESTKHTRATASSIEWRLHLDPNSTTKLTFSIDLKD